MKTALMRLEDREDYVDLVAQAVIDRIEERDRLAGLVEMVAHRVFELQKQQTALIAASEDTTEERHDAEK